MIFNTELSKLEFSFFKGKPLKWRSFYDLRKPSRPDPGRREKINLTFCFHTSMCCLKTFCEGLRCSFCRVAPSVESFLA